MSYAIRVFAKKVEDDRGHVFCEDSAPHWVVEGEYGPTARMDDGGEIDTDIMLFYTEASATKFAKKWKGHPWWVSPKGFEVVKVMPVMSSVLSHYEVCK